MITDKIKDIINFVIMHVGSHYCSFLFSVIHVYVIFCKVLDCGVLFKQRPIKHIYLLYLLVSVMQKNKERRYR